MTMLTIILLVIFPILGILAGIAARSYYGRINLSSAEAKSQRIIQDALKDAENKRKELLIEAKDQLLKEKNLMVSNADIQRLEFGLNLCLNYEEIMKGI